LQASSGTLTIFKQSFYLMFKINFNSMFSVPPC
jgi:hypothetical protein